MKFSFNRRNFLKSLATIPCAIVAYFVYEKLTEDDGVIRTIGAPQLPPAKPIGFKQDENRLCFHALGDTGLASDRREAVIQQMLRQAESVMPDLMFLVGDNFYDAGVESVDDPKWETDFEIPFAARFNRPFYACLGNHDYFGNAQAQVDYSRLNPQWNMPARYYTFVKSIDENTSVEFFVLDTDPIEEGNDSTRAQIQWLRGKLARSRADWKIVIGHHPLFTGGEHGCSRRNYRQLVPLFDEFQIDLYICGHDHDLQLHDTGRGWLHLVSGSGSKLRSVRWVETTLFAEAASGFARIAVTPERLAIEIFATDGLRFSHETRIKRQLAVAGASGMG